MRDRWADLSRTVAHALRHEPWLYELELDAAGWTSVDALLTALARDPRWRGVTRATLDTMIQRAPKQRYELVEDRIRALYGHSVPGRIQRTPGIPPVHLFHGTAAMSVEVIRAEGLRPMQRQYVHLSVDRSTAHTVGRRKSADVAVLLIEARAAHDEGTPFWVGNGKVWLAKHVPPRYVQVAGGS